MRASRSEISLPNFYHNLNFFRSQLKATTKLCLAVKGNAYGHGLSELSLRSPVDSFAVATVEEAAALRQAGIKQPILLLSPHLRKEIPYICELELQPLLSHCAYLPDYQTQAAKHNMRLRLHLKVDTGMCRAGVLPDKVLQLAQQVRLNHALELYGLCSHFASIESDPVQTQRQFECFQRIVQQLHRHGIAVPCVHIANSAAAIHYPESHFDMVRIGIGAYGYCVDVPELLPVLILKTKIGLVKKVPRGAKVSYGGTWVAPRDSLLALLPIGYADGYSRLLSNRGQVLFRDQLCPVVGNVCMDQMMIDLTEWAAQAQSQDDAVALEHLLEQDVELLGPHFNAQDMANQTNTIPYEVLTSISARVPRLYLD